MRKAKKQRTDAEFGSEALEISSQQRLNSLALPFHELFMDVVTHEWSSPGTVKTTVVQAKHFYYTSGWI